MKFMDCPLKYVGQTGRTFNTRYKEHIHDIISNTVTQDTQTIYNTLNIRNNNRRYGDNENREKGKIFEHIGKILYI
jgi:predicted helicase